MSILSGRKEEKSDRNKDQYASTPGITEIGGSRSYIGKTIQITGDLKLDEDLTIEGNIKGKIESTSVVTIGKEGSVNAEIKAQEVNIQGRVHGNITAAGRVVIFSEGEFLGDVNSKKLVIKEGAVFKGNVNMQHVPEISAFTKKTEKPPNIIEKK